MKDFLLAILIIAAIDAVLIFGFVAIVFRRELREAWAGRKRALVGLPVIDPSLMEVGK